MWHSKRDLFIVEKSILWIFILLNHINGIYSVRGCITILKEPKAKFCICTNYETGFTRIPEKFPDYVAELTIENQNIKTLDSSQLMNLPYLMNFTFNNNKLSRVIPNTFAYVPQLLSLKMSSNSLQLKESSLPSSSLIYLKNLKILDLSKNPLGFVPDYYFQSLKQLNILNLSGTMKGFFIEENGFYGLSNLQLLDLSSTHLTTLSDSLSLSFSAMQLQEFYIYKNPWICDCNLQWLKMWFTKYKMVKYSKDFRKDNKQISNGELFIDVQPKCHGPVNVQGKNLLSNSGDTGSIGIMDFKCAPKIFTKNKKVDISKGQNLTLTCDLHANPGGSVVWSKNGMVAQKHWPRVTWSTSQGIKFKAWLNIIEVEENDAGNWRCILTTNVGKVSATFSVKILSSSSQFEYKYILKYVGIGAVTIILLLVVIGIIIYCIYGFQIQNDQRRKSTSHEKMGLKNDSQVNHGGKNYRIIQRPNESVLLDDQILKTQYYNPLLMTNPSSIINPCMEQSHSPFSHYLINGSPSVCPLHGDLQKKHSCHSDTNEDIDTMKVSLMDCSMTHGHNVPCPVHGDVLSYLSTSTSTMTTSNLVYNQPDLNSTVYSKSQGEYILRVSSSNPTTIMTTSPVLEDMKYLSSVPEDSSFSFSTAI